MPFLFLLIASLTGACTSAKVGYDYDRNTDFTTYRTYEWLPGPQERTGDSRLDNSDVDMRIRIAVGGQLRLKGYTSPATGKPDFYVAYHVGLNDLVPDMSSQYYSPGMSGIPFTRSADSRYAGGHAPTSTPASPASLSGTLLVDVVDVSSNILVWRATADGTVDPGLTSEQRDERIRTIVHEMFTHFPPQRVKSARSLPAQSTSPSSQIRPYNLPKFH